MNKSSGPIKERLIIVSNRLPIVLSKEKEGTLKAIPGTGGLVTALAPILKNRGGLWIGWPGSVDSQELMKVLEEENRKSGLLLHPIFLSDEEIKLYYEGFANEIIWPLFHDLQSECHFDPRYWQMYQQVNRKFAEGIQNKLKPNDSLWVHDYHLMLVGQELRKLGSSEKIGFFLHIPFPSLDTFVKLPWRFQVLRALLEYDNLGFQTVRDKRNFIQCVKRLIPSLKIFNQKRVSICNTKDREVRIGAFPISIDFNEFSKMASSKEVSEQAWTTYENLKGQKIIFSCDRLDISKGITYRLEAIRHLLKNHPDLNEKVTFFQVVVPSRIEIPKYQELKKEIDRLIGEINSEFAKTGWVPIQYLFQSISRKELLAFYRISEIALITPVKDGMNLVAKEYVASNVDENGILILSEFAGAATQFQHEALLINPYDIEGVADTIYAALTLPLVEIKKRMRKMRRNVRNYDVFWWVRSFLSTSFENENDFPNSEEFTPIEEEKVEV
ncbi:MAG: trehalose-6-phosphate synthase [Parachlamydiaceae bacterium]|nr:trehalose-6-phosphate synthase [Parachlamydiaceae bacterium]